MFSFLNRVATEFLIHPARTFPTKEDLRQSLASSYSPHGFGDSFLHSASPAWEIIPPTLVHASLLCIPAGSTHEGRGLAAKADDWLCSASCVLISLCSSIFLFSIFPWVSL